MSETANKVLRVVIKILRAVLNIFGGGNKKNPDKQSNKQL